MKKSFLRSFYCREGSSIAFLLVSNLTRSVQIFWTQPRTLIVYLLNSSCLRIVRYFWTQIAFLIKDCHKSKNFKFTLKLLYPPHRGTSNFLNRLLLDIGWLGLKMSYIGLQDIMSHINQTGILGSWAHGTSDSHQLWYLGLYTNS